MSSLAQMVIRLVAEARQFKADLSDAAQHTQKVSADMVQSTTKVEKAVTALGDQMGVSRDLSDKAGAAVARMSGVFGGVAVAVGAAAAAVVAYAVIAKQVADESKRQADALTLTGNAAGLVSQQLNDMAREASAQINGQVGNMRSTMESLVASGRVSQTSLAEVAKGVELVARFSGQSREAVAKDFAGMADDVGKWAAEHNKQYHYLTLDQYKYIESLQKAGDVQGAMKANMDALAKSMGGDLAKNLGTLQKLWHGVGTLASWAWDKMLGWGREKTGSEKLEQMAKDLEFLQGKKYQNNDDAKRIAAIKERMNLQREENAQEIKAATEKAAIAAKAEEQIKSYREGQKANGVKGAKADPNREIDAEIAALKAGEAAKAEVVKQGLDTIASERKRGVISESDALQQTVALQLQALGDKRATVEAELELSKKKTNSQKEQATLQGQIAALEAQQRTIAIKYGNDYFEMLAKGNLAAAEAHYKYIDSLEKGLAKMQQDAAAQGEHNARLGLSKQAIAALDAEKLRSQAVTLELMAIKQLDKNLDEEQYRIYKAQAKALRDLADAKQTGAAKEAGIEAEKAIAEEAKRTAETIERTLTDALMRGFESGKGFARNLYDATVNLFKTLVLRPVIQGVVNGVFGVPGAAMAQTAGASGGVSSALSLGSSAANFLGLNSAAGLGSVFGSNAAYGAAIGTSSIGAGSQAAMLAAQTGEFGAAGAMATSSAAAGSGAGFMATIGPAMPYIAAAVGVYMLAKSLSDPTKPSIEGGYSTMGDPGTNGRAYVAGADGAYYGGTLDKGAKALVTGTAGDYSAIVKSAGYKAGDFTAQAFMGFDGNGGSKGSKNALDYVASLNGKQIYNRYSDLGTNSAGTTDANMSDASKEASTKSILSALEATDLGPQLNAYLDKVKINGASLAEVTASLGDVTSYIAFSNAVKSLPFDYLKNVSVEATKALAAAAGGMDQFGASLGTYFDLFGTDAEKQAALTSSLSASFADIGSTMPTANAGLRDWYKGEVARLGAMDLTNEANAKAYASALKLASGVDTLAKAEEQALATKQSWQDQLDVLTGKTTDNDLALKRDLASTTDASTQAIIRQVYAEKERKKTLEADDKARTAQISSAKAALDKAVTAQKNLIQATVDAAQQNVTAFTGLFDLLKTQVAELYNQVDSTAAMSAQAGRAFISQALATANSTGYLPEQSALSDAISAARGGLNSASYKSQFEQDRAALVMASELAQLKDKAGTQLSTAEEQVRIAKKQLVDLDTTVKLMQDQIDASNGINTSVLSVADAIAALQIALKPASTTGAKTTGTGTTGGTVSAGPGGGITNLGATAATGHKGDGSGNYYSETLLPYGLSSADRVTDPGQIARYETIQTNVSGMINRGDSFADIAAAAQANGVTMNDIATATGYNYADVYNTFTNAGIPRFADGGMHTGGLRLVGELGPEIEAVGPARYWDASTTQRMLSGMGQSGGYDAGAAAYINQLHQQLKAQTTAMLVMLNEHNSILRRWEGNGMPPTREVAA